VDFNHDQSYALLWTDAKFQAEVTPREEILAEPLKPTPIKKEATQVVSRLLVAP
jgi:hypothetical protein